MSADLLTPPFWREPLAAPWALQATPLQARQYAHTPIPPRHNESAEHTSNPSRRT